MKHTTLTEATCIFLTRIYIINIVFHSNLRAATSLLCHTNRNIISVYCENEKWVFLFRKYFWVFLSTSNMKKKNSWKLHWFSKSTIVIYRQSIIFYVIFKVGKLNNISDLLNHQIFLVIDMLNSRSKLQVCCTIQLILFPWINAEKTRLPSSWYHLKCYVIFVNNDIIEPENVIVTMRCERDFPLFSMETCSYRDFREYRATRTDLPVWSSRKSSISLFTWVFHHPFHFPVNVT